MSHQVSMTATLSVLGAALYEVPCSSLYYNCQPHGGVRGNAGVSTVCRINPHGTTNICTKLNINPAKTAVDAFQSPPKSASHAVKNWNDLKILNSAKGISASQESNVDHNSSSLCVCACADEELQSEDELDKELLWNLQLLSEVRQGSITSNTLRNRSPNKYMTPQNLI